MTLIALSRRSQATLNSRGVMTSSARSLRIRFTSTRRSAYRRRAPWKSCSPQLMPRRRVRRAADVGALVESRLRRLSKAECPVPFHELLMRRRGFAARRANMGVILEKNHTADAVARAAPKINNR